MRSLRSVGSTSTLTAFFLDTSALVKRYHEEVGTPEIDRLFDDPQAELIISRLGFVELQSALASKVRSGNSIDQDRETARKNFLGTSRPALSPWCAWSLRTFALLNVSF